MAITKKSKQQIMKLKKIAGNFPAVFLFPVVCLLLSVV